MAAEALREKYTEVCDVSLVSPSMKNVLCMSLKYLPLTQAILRPVVGKLGTAWFKVSAAMILKYSCAVMVARCVL